jgi:alpha-methylacyl-CoA racemase
MVLADAGADVLRIDRAHDDRLVLVEPQFDLLNRGKRSVAIDLKQPEGVGLVLDLIERTDVLIEGYRPGVMERLGLGPDVCLSRSERLVYARVTGWGQDGPLAQAAGHDIDYIAVAGVLHPIGRLGAPPPPPMNLIGDFGGGGMLAANGILCALIERQTSGRGQVIDVAMVDGAALLSTAIHGFVAGGSWTDDRAANLLDSGAPFYDVYETADGRYLAVGAIEPQFYAALLKLLGLDEPPHQLDQARWPAMHERFADAIRTRTLDDWLAAADGLDACVAPVLSLTEAPRHPHNVARGVFTTVQGVVQPAPAPRFSRSVQPDPKAPSWPGSHTEVALRDWGVDDARVAQLRRSGAIS